MQQLRIEGLPEDPLAAAAAFHVEWLPRAFALLGPPRNGEVAAGTADGGGSLPDARLLQAAPPLHHPADGPPPRGGEDLILIFAPADHTHRGWRLAAVQGLARDYAPRRINAVEAEGEAAIASTSAYLAAAPGLTGQCLSWLTPGPDRC